MIEIVHNNWPELLEKYKINGAISVMDPVTDDQRHQLRGRKGKVHVNVINQVGDDIFMGQGGGFTTNGGSLSARLEANKIIKRCGQIEELVRKNQDQIYRMIVRNVDKAPKELELRLHVLDNDGFILFESNTGLMIKHMYGSDKISIVGG